MVEEGASPGLMNERKDNPNKFPMLGQQIEEIRTVFNSSIGDEVVIFCENGDTLTVSGEKLAIHYAQR